MGKVVKYCSACEEGFAEKFGFCPNCGSNLQAFEMNPLGGMSAAPDVNAAPVVETPVETPAEAEAAQISETQTFSAAAPQDEPAETVEASEFRDEDLEEPVAETKTFVAPETLPETNTSDDLYRATFAKSSDAPVKNDVPHYVSDGGYQPTIVVERNVKQRNTLLLGAFALGCTLMLGSYVYSMFNKYLDIAAIDTPDLLAYVGEVDPTQMDIEEEPKKEKDEGGGGGGGGKDEQNKVSKGREAAQMPDPDLAPSAYMDKVTNPELTLRVGTVNKNPRPAENVDMPYGLKNGGDTLSDGDGTGGGQGGGRGRGQGDGEGSGFGLGRGSGRGGGDGDGEGDGSGGGGNRNPDNLVVKTKPVGPTEGVKILSKPRANYTDTARQNQVQGKVVLRVTFAANGSIGAISVISGLGSGLTEQAIAAARGIKFEPAKRAGQPYSVTKPVEYTFTIY